MLASRMTAREHARQRERVAASLLLIGEGPRLARDVPIDPGTLTASAGVGSGRGALLAGGMQGGLPDFANRSVEARSVR
jgi:hypothetical protein